MVINISDIKKLRQQTGAGVADCRRYLEEAGGDSQKAMELIKQKGMDTAVKKAGREVKAGSVFSYVHHNGRVGVLVALGCETDFVAETEDFQVLGKELTLQIAASRPQTVVELLDQEYVRDPAKTVGGLIKEVIAKLGENITVLDFKVIDCRVITI